MRTYLAWCATPSLDRFAATRSHIEICVKGPEEGRPLAPATVARIVHEHRIYRFMIIDGHLDKSPAEYVRRPWVPSESQAGPANPQ